MLEMGKNLLFALVKQLGKVATAEKATFQFIANLLADGIFLFVDVFLLVRHDDCSFTLVRLVGNL